MKRGIYRTLFQWGFAALLILLLFCFGDVSNLVRLQDVRWNAFLMVFLCNTAFSIAHNFRWKLIVDHLSGEKEQGTVGPGFHHPQSSRSKTDESAARKQTKVSEILESP